MLLRIERTLASNIEELKMKGFLAIFTLLFVLISCHNSTKKDEKAAENTLHRTLTTADSLQNQITQKSITKLNIQSIKECAEQGIYSFNMDSVIDPKKYLDNSIVDNILGKVPVNEQKDWLLKANDWERFSCYRWEENQDYFLFTLLQQDESCCLTMYLCVADKSGQLLTIRQLGLIGGDGGWFQNDWGERIGFGRFKLFSESYYDEHKRENGVDIGFNREHEHTELQISLDEKTFIVDTLHYTKTDTLIAI